MPFVWFLLGLIALHSTRFVFVPLWRWLRPRPLEAAPPPLAVVRTPSLLPLGLEAALARVDRPLRALGFEPQPPVRDARDAGKVRGGTSGVAQLWRHPVSGDVATITVALQDGTRPLSVLAFSTPLADGSTLETSDEATPRSAPVPPDVRHARFAREEPKPLYALHRARATAHAVAPTEPIADAVAAHRALEQRARDWWVRCGYLRARGPRLRPTLRGAFGGYCRTQFPWATLDGRRHAAERTRLAAVARVSAQAPRGASWSSRFLFE